MMDVQVHDVDNKMLSEKSRSGGSLSQIRKNGVLIMGNLNKEDVENDDIEALESVDSNSKNSATENGRTTQQMNEGIEKRYMMQGSFQERRAFDPVEVHRITAGGIDLEEDGKQAKSFSNIKGMQSFYSEGLGNFRNDEEIQVKNARSSQGVVGVGDQQNTSSSTHSFNKEGSSTKLQIQLPSTKTTQFQLLPLKGQASPMVIDIQSTWKYLLQPSYARIGSVIYHQNREVRLEIDSNQVLTTRNGQQQLFSSVPLITQQSLSDFYSLKGVKLFPNLGRELEVDEEPEAIYREIQQEISTCSEAEIRVHDRITQCLKQDKRERDFQLKNQPIMFRFVKESTIFFNSRFESGNLREVEKLSEFEYNLFLNFDFNTLNYTQWYYFSVRNIKKGFTYKFNIMNLQKDDSSYNYGMKPFVFSTQRNKEEGTYQWCRGCDNIEYYKNHLKTKLRESAPDYEYDEANIPFYVYEDAEAQQILLNTLSFTYTFEYDEDTVFFSYFQPYTYTDLKDYFYSLTKKYSVDHLKNVLRIQELCQTIEGNTCHLLTITDNAQQEQTQAVVTNPQKEPKQIVYLTGRVHPGESNASYLVQGCIDLLLQQTKESQHLREQFVFKIIPMLNPDGVIRGNYRCNSLGVDLNRRWQNPSKLLHPTIYHAKHLAKQISKDNQIILFCDMHGHSRKRNVFMYGCVSPQSDLLQHRNNNLIKLVPYMLSQKNKLFSFNDCKFANEREKESTARLVMFREFQVLNSYTLESTFYAQYSKEHFKKKRDVDNDLQVKGDDLLLIGHDMCLSLSHILQSKILKKKFLQQQEGVGGGGSVNPIQSQLPSLTGTQPSQVPMIKDSQVSSNSIMQGGRDKSTGRDGYLGNLPSQIRDQSGINSLNQSNILGPQTVRQSLTGSSIPLLNQLPLQTASIGLVGDITPQGSNQPQNHPQNFIIKHQQSLPHQPENNNLVYPHSNLTLKKRSERTIGKDQNYILQPPLQSKDQMYESPPKKRGQAAQAVFMNPNPTSQGQSPFQVTQITGINQQQQQVRVQLKSNVVKQNILEAPNQVNAVLVNQFVQLSRGVKVNQQELFKFHNQNNFKGLVTTIANSAQKPASGTQFTPDKRNISCNMASQSKILSTIQPNVQKPNSVRTNASQPPQMTSNMLLSALLSNNNYSTNQQPGMGTSSQFNQFYDQQQLVIVNVPHQVEKLPYIIQKQIQKQQSSDDNDPQFRRPVTSNSPLRILDMQQTVNTKFGLNNNAPPKDYPQPQVLRPTTLVFHPHAKMEYVNPHDIQQHTIQQIPKMGNTIIQKALEQSQQQQQQVSPNALYNKKPNYQTNPQVTNQIGTQRRKIIEKLNSFKTNQVQPPPQNASYIQPPSQYTQDQVGPQSVNQSHDFKKGNFTGAIANYVQQQRSSDEAALLQFRLQQQQQFSQNQKLLQQMQLHDGFQSQFSTQQPLQSPPQLYSLNHTQNLQQIQQPQIDNQRISLPNLINVVKVPVGVQDPQKSPHVAMSHYPPSSHMMQHGSNQSSQTHLNGLPISSSQSHNGGASSLSQFFLFPIAQHQAQQQQLESKARSNIQNRKKNYKPNNFVLSGVSDALEADNQLSETVKMQIHQDGFFIGSTNSDPFVNQQYQSHHVGEGSLQKRRSKLTEAIESTASSAMQEGFQKPGGQLQQHGASFSPVKRRRDLGNIQH